MTPSGARHVPSKRHGAQTAASEKLRTARLRARLQIRQLGAGLGLHPRSVARWETGETHPSKAQWSKIVAYLARFVPAEAVELARAAGVPSPIPVAEPVDTRALGEALLQAADLLDVSPRRVRAAVRELMRAAIAARATLEDLARAAAEKPEPT